MSRTCDIEGCDRPHNARGFCVAHYKRHRKGADLHAPVRLTGNDDLRFWSKIAKGEGCWIWQGPPNAQGYGAISYGGKRRTAHRVSYEINVGPIPEGMQIDHACRVKLCVNPKHLRVVTDGENKQNLAAYARSKSGIRGVTYYPKRRKWIAMAQRDGVKHYLGWHATAEAAEAAVSTWRKNNMPYSEMDKRKETA